MNKFMIIFVLISFSWFALMQVDAWWPYGYGYAGYGGYGYSPYYYYGGKREAGFQNFLPIKPSNGHAIPGNRGEENEIA
ncbi:hypothetical protein ACQ4LE_009811 [Meloidogyne hapla]|uniref:Uncharacterized protein n=1 Tax=Meloidogyne hapla TaxID=6305 RepID=A0A1I8BYE0_MELHA